MGISRTMIDRMTDTMVRYYSKSSKYRISVWSRYHKQNLPAHRSHHYSPDGFLDMAYQLTTIIFVAP